MNKALQCILLVLFFTVIQSSQVYSSTDTLYVGVKHSPPFLYSENGNIHGINAQLFESVAQSLNLEYQYVEFPYVDSLIAAIQSGQVDIAISPLTVTSSRYAHMSFSQPIFIGGIGVVARKGQGGLFVLFSQIFSWQFMEAIFFLLFVISVFGFLLWLAERKKNNLQFSQGPKGLLDGLWWSAVTMTTVGYGDKSPTTVLGRLIAVVWMFTAVITISSFTASIASSLTVGQLADNIQSVSQLKGKSVGTVESSASAQLLEDRYIPNQTFQSVPQLLEALQKKEIDYAIYDKEILNYYVREQKSNDLVVFANQISNQYYSFAFTSSLPLQDKINYEIMHVLESDEWEKVLEQFK